MRLLCGLVALAICTAAVAQELDADGERAQALFHQGTERYAAHDYAGAVERMEAARRLRPLPAFDHAIARCYDRMGEARAALEAYERYLAGARSDDTAYAEARERARALRARVGAVRRRARRMVAPAVCAGLAVALVATGGGLAGSAAAAYGALEARWLREGKTADVIGTADGLRDRERAGFALIAIGAGVAVTDVVLWGLSARRREPVED